MEKILIISPTKVDLGIIKKWLIEEDEIFNQGFYCNWNIIEYAFNRDELFSRTLKSIFHSGNPMGIICLTPRIFCFSPSNNSFRIKPKRTFMALLKL